MADDFNDIESNFLTTLRADSTLTGLLGTIIVDSGATLDEGLDASETGINITGTAPTVGDVWKIEDELMLVGSYSAPTATVTREYASTTAAIHATGLSIKKRIPSVHDMPREDFTRYQKSELPVVSLMCSDSFEDDDSTFTQFDKGYTVYIEAFHSGGDPRNVEGQVKRIMAEVRRIVRDEKSKSLPFIALNDVWNGATDIARGTAGRNQYVVMMFTNVEALVIGTN